MKTLQIPFAVSSAPLSKCRALLKNSIVMNIPRLFSKAFTYEYNSYLCTFSYFNACTTVDILFSSPNYIYFVSRQENGMDIPNEKAQLDYLINNFEQLKAEFKTLKFDVVL